MLQLETSPPERVRVIGALTGAALLMLLDMVKTAEVLLDLSEVHEADTDAVGVLARLGPGVWIGSPARAGSPCASRAPPLPAERDRGRKPLLRGSSTSKAGCRAGPVCDRRAEKRAVDDHPRAGHAHARSRDWTADRRHVQVLLDAVDDGVAVLDLWTCTRSTIAPCARWRSCGRSAVRCSAVPGGSAMAGACGETERVRLLREGRMYGTRYDRPGPGRLQPS